MIFLFTEFSQKYKTNVKYETTSYIVMFQQNTNTSGKSINGLDSYYVNTYL